MGGVARPPTMAAPMQLVAWRALSLFFTFFQYVYVTGIDL